MKKQIEGFTLQEPQAMECAEWLMAHSDVHKKWTAKDVKRLILPPVKLGQYFIFGIDKGPEYDIEGFATWANMTAEAESALRWGHRKLQPEDFNSGDFSRIWIIDFIAPFGKVLPMGKIIRTALNDRANAEGWPAKEAKWRRTFGTGKTQHVGSVNRDAIHRQ